jgi:peptidoglycan/xylan/chitin deacetylase (PgdA/CDA1 family)
MKPNINLPDTIYLTPLRRILAVLVAACLALVSCQKTPTGTISPKDPTAPSAAQTATPVTGLPSPMPTFEGVTREAASMAASTATQPVMTETPTATTGAAATLGGTAIPAGKMIMPILLYHHVSDKIGGRYSIPVQTFREQMETLKKAGYTTISISQAAEAIRSGGTLPAQPIAITFDDGYVDTYENAFPILREQGYTATVYIITGTIGTKLSYGYMQAEALKALAAAGWEIGSHSVSHNDLMKTKLGAGNEMKQSKKTLEELLGTKVRSFSYPFGLANPSLKELAAQSGYDSAVGIDVLNTHTARQLYFLSRREVYRSLPLWGFEKLLEPSEADQIIATQSAAATP